MTEPQKLIIFSGHQFKAAVCDLRVYWVAIPLALALIFAIVNSVLSDEYEATAVLAPSEERTGGLAEMTGGLAGLAGLAGIDLGSGQLNNTQMALEVLKTRSFQYHVIEKYDLLPYLLAMEAWDNEANAPIFDTSLYNPDTKQWVREVEPPRQQEPELWEGYNVLNQQIDVNYDRTARIVRLALRNPSPELAAQWLQNIISELNEVMRNRERDNVSKQIDYLSTQAEEAQQSEVRESLFGLLQEQYKRAMLVEVNQDYVFEVIDPPVVPHRATGLSTALLFFIGALLGGFVMFAWTMLRSYVRQ